MGKGSKQRPTDQSRFSANYDKIWGRKDEPIIPTPFEPLFACPTCGMYAEENIRLWGELDALLRAIENMSDHRRKYDVK